MLTGRRRRPLQGTDRPRAAKVARTVASGKFQRKHASDVEFEYIGDSDSSVVSNHVECIQLDEDTHRVSISWTMIGLMPIWKELLKSIPYVSTAWWLRRNTRRRVLKHLADECAQFWPKLFSVSADLRAQAARKRLQALRSGDVEQHSALAAATHEKSIQAILDGTEHILEELKMPVDRSLKLPSIDTPSILKGGNLMPHQLHGLRWLVALCDNKMSGILADDMGLGKTVQTLALIGHLLENRGNAGPHLIVVPVSVLPHWVDELTKWLPTVKYMVLRGSSRQMGSVAHEMLCGASIVSVVLTSCETVVSQHEFVSRFPWSYVIVDEGHRLKNIKARFSQAIHSVSCQHRLLLTGTPLQNSLEELWGLLTFVAPRSFSALDTFKQWFALPPLPPCCRDREAANSKYAGQPSAETDCNTVKRLLSEEEELLIIRRLHRILRPFLLRRTKSLVLADLPTKQELVIWVPLSSWQAVLYRKVLQCLRPSISRVGRSKKAMKIVALRKATNHPFHFLKDASSAQQSDLLFKASGKFELLDRLLPRLIQFKHKILIYAQMTALIDWLEQILLRHNLQFVRIGGKTSLRMRKCAVDKFREDPDTGIFLLSTRSGGTGLNLQMADTVILFDSDWNPQVDLQAMGRAHRIGQKRPVNIVRIMTPTSLDHGLLERAHSKLDMERKVISAGQFDNGGLHDDEILPRLVHEARHQRILSFGKHATPLTEINAMLARSEEERLAFDAGDDALLGPAAAGDGGVEESVIERLERCGRLVTSQEIPDEGNLRRQ